MKHQMMNSEWRRLPRLSGFVFGAAIMLFLALSVQAQFIPPGAVPKGEGGMFLGAIGGTEGSQFIDRCYEENLRQLRQQVEIRRSGGAI